MVKEVASYKGKLICCVKIKLSRKGQMEVFYIMSEENRKKNPAQFPEENFLKMAACFLAVLPLAQQYY